MANCICLSNDCVFATNTDKGCSFTDEREMIDGVCNQYKQCSTVIDKKEEHLIRIKVKCWNENCKFYRSSWAPPCRFPWIYIENGKCSSYEFDPVTNKWIIDIKGGPDDDYEISAVREKNRHGRESWGWFGKNKRLISAGKAEDGVDKIVFNELIKVAHKVVKRLNKEGPNHGKNHC